MDTIIFSNFTIQDILIAAGSVIVVFFLLQIFRKLLRKKNPPIYAQQARCFGVRLAGPGQQTRGPVPPVQCASGRPESREIPKMMIKKLISGAQTGADRAALDFAINNDIPHGGWVPRGRKAEDGVIPDRYHVKETPEPEYSRRTALNVMDSDGTLIFSHGPLTGGSALTEKLARKYNKACSSH